MSARFGPESPPKFRRRLLALHVELELHSVSAQFNVCEIHSWTQPSRWR